MKKILILEEDRYIREFAAGALNRAGFVAVEAASGNEALEKLQRQDDLCGAVLDVTVSDVDVFEICQSIRQQLPQTAILLLASQEHQTDAITGLMTGADDLLCKPFSPEQLVSAVNTLLTQSREYMVEAGQLLSSGPFILNTRAYSLEKREQVIALTRAEYSMVKFFLENPGKALSRKEIYDYVWGRDENADLKTVEEKVRRLRLKLEDDPRKPAYITTVWGYGYQWNH